MHYRRRYFISRRTAISVHCCQSLYKKARFVFGRDCRVALRAPRNDR
ncbi:MAG: hypothetical protein LBL66_01055 [Clostridiales bacterium]|nr:hypothetical protein [Clostridiales bacterium]